MANFGKDNLTSLISSSQSVNDQIHNRAFSGDASGPLQNIYLYCNDYLEDGPYTVYAALYSHDSSNDRPQNLLDSGSATLAASADWGWLKIPMTDNYIVESSTTYWLSANWTGPGSQIGWYRQSPSGHATNNYSYVYTTAGTWIDPWTTDAQLKLWFAIYGETGALTTTNPGGDINWAHTKGRQ